MKRLFSAALTMALCIALLASPSSAKPERSYSAAATNNAIAVSNSTDVPDAHLVYPAVYKIEGANYFKLRDLAKLLNGSAKQFAVDYDDHAKAVSITSGKPYIEIGTELSGTAGKSRSATVSNNTVSINGSPAVLTVFKIDGENYFKLRDLGKALDFRVGYNEETKTVCISGARGYETADPGTVTMSVVKDSCGSKTTRFVLQNDSDRKYTYGPEYALEVSENGQWHEIVLDVPMSWNAVIMVLEPRSTREFTVDWSSSGYGELKEGKYRLRKSVCDADRNWSVVYAEFEIRELCGLPLAPEEFMKL